MLTIDETSEDIAEHTSKVWMAINNNYPIRVRRTFHDYDAMLAKQWLDNRHIKFVAQCVGYKRSQKPKQYIFRFQNNNDALLFNLGVANA